MANLISTAEAARILGLDQRQVRHLCQTGAIVKAKKLGRDWYAPEASFRAYERDPRGWPAGKKRKPSRKAS